MTNSKKRLFTVLSLVVIMCLSIFTFAACSNTDSVVKFMVQENGEWKENSQVKAVDGAVEAPQAPAKEYYTFAGWYLDQEFKSAFDTSKVDTSVSVYAKYTPIETTVIMDGIFQGNKKLADVKANNAGIVAKEGLTFDGWYKDATCQVKWNGEADVQALYARSMAKLTFNNGLENIAEQLVPVDSIYPNPSEKTVVVEGEEVTLISTMVKPYMSPMGIDYVDAEGKDIDFTKPVTKNMNITVKWSSKIGDSSYELNPLTGKYTIKLTTDMEFENSPVLSFRSTATIMEDGKAKKIDVEAIDVQTSAFIPTTVSKIIFEEGIKSIKGVNGDGVCPVEEVILPASAKIVDNSFNNMPKLKKVVMPEGVEVIIGSFFNTGSFDYKSRYYGSVHDFDINVPASVTNMAMVPNNFVFAEGSAFSKDANGCIFKTEGKGEAAKKVLISDPQAYANFNVLGDAIADTIVVPECDYIQVGTYNTIFNYLILPAKFAGIKYNVKLADYNYYTAYTSNILYDEASKANPASSTTNVNAYAITGYVGGYKMDASFIKEGCMWEEGAGKVVFTAAIPTDLDKYAFVGDDTGDAAYAGTYKPMDNETVKQSIIVKDSANKAYVSFEYANKALVEYMGIGTSVNSIIVEDSTFNKDLVLNTLAANKNTEDVNAALFGNDIKFYANNKEITLNEITGNMFITVKVVEVPKLIINSAYRVSCDKDWEIFDDPSKFTGDYFVLSGWGQQTDKAVIKDVTGLSKDTILNTFAAQMAKQFYPMVSDNATEAVLIENIMWSFNNATSLKIMMNGEEVTDFSKINLDNGSVTLDIEVEFAPYTTQA